MEREEYLKPEIISETIEIGVYGFYGGDDNDGLNTHKIKKLRKQKKH